MWRKFIFLFFVSFVFSVSQNTYANGVEINEDVCVVAFDRWGLLIDKLEQSGRISGRLMFGLRHNKEGAVSMVESPNEAVRRMEHCRFFLHVVNASLKKIEYIDEMSDEEIWREFGLSNANDFFIKKYSDRL